MGNDRVAWLRLEAVAYAGFVMNSDPEGGIAWVKSIENPDLRDATLLAEGRSWLQRDPNAAGVWLESAGLPEAPLDRIRVV